MDANICLCFSGFRSRFVIQIFYTLVLTDKRLVVANMFFIPMGIWVRTPHLTVRLYIWKGIIPAALGNIIGGGLFVGSYVYYQYLQGVDAPTIDGRPYGASQMALMDFRNAHIDLGRRAPRHEEETIGISGSSTPMTKVGLSGNSTPIVKFDHV